MYVHKWSSDSGATAAAIDAAAAARAAPPARPHHVRSSSSMAGISNIKRNQNMAAKAAAQRLAQVMDSQASATDIDDDDDDYNEDDLGFGFAVPRSLGVSWSSTVNRINGNKRIISNGVKTAVPSAKTSSNNSRSSSPGIYGEEAEAGGGGGGGRSSMSIRSTPSRPSPKAPIPMAIPPPTDPPSSRLKEKRFPQDMGKKKRATSALHDELDMLQEENKSFQENVIAEESCEEAEARVKELEKGNEQFLFFFFFEAVSLDPQAHKKLRPNGFHG